MCTCKSFLRYMAEIKLPIDRDVLLHCFNATNSAVLY